MRAILVLASVVVLGLGLSACETVGHGGYQVTVAGGSPPPPPPPAVVVHEHHGPPPHAPAHGYRHKHRHHGHDVELVYDTGVGCYSVVGYRDHYYNDGFYFRIGSDGWQVSASISGDARWDYAPDRRVPSGLKVKYKDHHHGDDDDQGRGKGKGKGKGNKRYSSAEHWGKFGA